LKKRFGVRLRTLRQAANLTQSDLAEMVGISDRYLGRMERGLVSPSFECVEKIARALGIETASLFLSAKAPAHWNRPAAVRASASTNGGPLQNFPGMTIKMVDPDMRIVWSASSDPRAPCNKGIDCIGHRCHEVYHMRPEPCSGCQLPEALATGSVREAQIVTPAGRTLVTRSEPIRDADGSVTGAVHLSLDTTGRDRMQEALRQAEQRLEYLFASGPMVLHVRKADESLSTTYISANVRALFGHAPEAFLDSPGYWLEQLHPEERERLLAGLPQLLEHGRLVQEYRFRSGDGGWRWIRDDMRRVRDAAGDPLEIVGSWMDVTDAKAFEKVMRDAQSRHQTLFEANCTVQLLIDAETQVILDANPAACAYYGYTREQLRKMHIGDINVLPPGELAHELALAGSSGKDLFQFRHRLADGAIREVESRVTPVLYGDRTVLHSLIIDVTGRNSALRESLANTALWESLFENTPGRVALLDKDGRIIRCSALFAREFGVSSAELAQAQCLFQDPGDGALPATNGARPVRLRLGCRPGCFQALVMDVPENDSPARSIVTVYPAVG
jgi:PAS domain S-box-containing protein